MHLNTADRSSFIGQFNFIKIDLKLKQEIVIIIASVVFASD